MLIPFNKVYHSENEEKYVLESLRSGKHCGNHQFCTKVVQLMKENHNFNEIFSALGNCSPRNGAF